MENNQINYLQSKQLAVFFNKNLYYTTYNSNMNFLKENIMSKCPYCNPGNPFESDTNYLNNIINDITNDINIKDAYAKNIKDAFNNRFKQYKCIACNCTYYIYQFGIDCCSITKENYIKMLNNLGINNLTNYLPTADLKERYQDLLDTSNLSDKVKLAITRPLLEAYLNYKNGVKENEKVRQAIKDLKEDSLKSAFHIILDESLKGVHVKDKEIEKTPQLMLNIFEALFIKEFENPAKQKEIDKKLEDALNKLK